MFFFFAQDIKKEENMTHSPFSKGELTNTGQPWVDLSIGNRKDFKTAIVIMNRSQQRARHHHCITMLESRQEMTSSKPENSNTAIQSGGQREDWMQDDMQIMKHSIFWGPANGSADKSTFCHTWWWVWLDPNDCKRKSISPNKLNKCNNKIDVR